MPARSFLRDLTHKVMPSSVFWGYDDKLEPVFKNLKSGRWKWDSATRFRNDYLAATMLGFLTDKDKIVLYKKGDGITLVDDTLTIIDQNDEPDYMAGSINSPGTGFEMEIYNISDISRLAICCDGLRHLMCPLGDDELKSFVVPGQPHLIRLVYGQDLEEPEFVQQMFNHMPGHMLGLQFLLNENYRDQDELMGDDCSIVTFANNEEEDTSKA